MRGRISITGLLLAGGLALSTPAYAQDEPGVHVDPDSPGKKEYELPVEEQRRKADPNQDDSQNEAPLFGEGLETPTPTPTVDPAIAARERAEDRRREKRQDARKRARAKARREAARERELAKATATAEADKTPAAVRAAAVEPATPEGGVGTTLLLVGGAASVLVLAIGGGIAMRRRGQGD
jgi:hypothetical protein